MSRHERQLFTKVSKFVRATIHLVRYFFLLESKELFNLWFVSRWNWSTTEGKILFIFEVYSRFDVTCHLHPVKGRWKELWKVFLSVPRLDPRKAITNEHKKINIIITRGFFIAQTKSFVKTEKFAIKIEKFRPLWNLFVSIIKVIKIEKSIPRCFNFQQQQNFVLFLQTQIDEYEISRKTSTISHQNNLKFWNCSAAWYKMRIEKNRLIDRLSFCASNGKVEKIQGLRLFLLPFSLKKSK